MSPPYILTWVWYYLAQPWPNVKLNTEFLINVISYQFPFTFDLNEFYFQYETHH